MFCQLDTLRRCPGSSIRKALNELPNSLDDTYERMLQGIPKEVSELAGRLFQCMVATLRPLRVEELAEIFAIEFGPNNVPKLVPSWRPVNSEEAILSTCSTFITITGDEGSKFVQFSHFSVKEYLTSDRLQTSTIGNIGQYYITLEPAHAILAQACVSLLLQLDENEDEGRFRALPLASYATTNWLRHAQFGDVSSRIQGSLAYLFDPRRPHFTSRILWRDVKDSFPVRPTCFDEPDSVTPLFFVAVCGFSEPARHLVVTHALDVNTKCAHHGISPLHGPSISGHVGSSRILLDHGANVNAQDDNDWTPLHIASAFGHLGVAQLLLKRKANSNARTKDNDTPLCLAAENGHLEIVRLLLDDGGDVTIRGCHDLTPHQIATERGHDDVAQLLSGIRRQGTRE